MQPGAMERSGTGNMTDERFMEIALALAKKGMGRVNPNPMVGAVIAKEGKLIGQGFHERYGGPHAERNALRNCKENPEGAVLYVTLEPCCHYGKTPPCTEAIIKSGIKKVVTACSDPNPEVAGKGIDTLRTAGIEVVTGILREECERLNEVFFHCIQKNTPFVVMKYAMTMDGKIAAACGDSKWITGEEARENVHLDRGRYSSIMVGVRTVIKDNPLLTCRMSGGRNPIRIVCDTNLYTPLEAAVVELAGKAGQGKTIIATSCKDKEKQEKFKQRGCEIIVLPKENGHIDLKLLMKELWARGINSVFLEGGGTLNFSALQEGIVNKIQTYIAPKILGGEKAKTPVEGMGVERMADCIRLKNQRITRFGEDFLIESEVDDTCLPG